MWAKKRLLWFVNLWLESGRTKLVYYSIEVVQNILNY